MSASTQASCCTSLVAGSKICHKSELESSNKNIINSGFMFLKTLLINLSGHVLEYLKKNNESSFSSVIYKNNIAFLSH